MHCTFSESSAISVFHLVWLAFLYSLFSRFVFLASLCFMIRQRRLHSQEWWFFWTRTHCLPHCWLPPSSVIAVSFPLSSPLCLRLLLVLPRSFFCLSSLFRWGFPQCYRRRLVSRARARGVVCLSRGPGSPGAPGALPNRMQYWTPLWL